MHVTNIKMRIAAVIRLFKTQVQLCPNNVNNSSRRKWWNHQERYMQTDQRNVNVHEEMIKGDTFTTPAEHFYDRQPAHEGRSYRNRSQERQIPVIVTARTDFRPNIDGLTSCSPTYKTILYYWP